VTDGVLLVSGEILLGDIILELSFDCWRSEEVLRRILLLEYSRETSW
jgi:hypothetical protein